MNVGTNPEQTATELASSDWAQAHRATGAAITVQGANGGYYHADESFWPMIGRAEPTKNGFDLIPPQFAGPGAEMLAEFNGRAARVWFPFKSDRGKQVWCKFESNWDSGLLACAIWPEPDRAMWKLHAEPLE